MRNQMKQMKPEEMQDYVKNIMEQTLPKYMQEMMKPEGFMKGFQPESGTWTEASNDHEQTKFQTSVFETHDYVYVMITVHDQNQLQNLKLFHTSNQLIIEDIPQLADKQTITLPAIVKRKGAKALYKDGILEIKIPKNIDMQFSEIDVSTDL